MASWCCSRLSSKGTMFRVVDEINLMPTVTAILAASNIPTFPYVTVEEVQTALEQHDSVGDSSPLDKSIRARVDHTLRRASDRDGRLNINSFSRTVKDGAAAYTTSLLFRDALKKLVCCLILVAPLCCAILAGILGVALAYYQGWSFETGILVALEEVLLTDQDFASNSATSQQDNLELGTLAAKGGLAVCSLWGVAFLGMLVGVIGGPLTHPILAQLNLLPNDGRTHKPDVVCGVDVSSVRDPARLALRCSLQTARKVEHVEEQLAKTQQLLEELLEEVMEQHGKVIARNGRKKQSLPPSSAGGASHNASVVSSLSPTAAAHATVDRFSSGNVAPSLQQLPQGNQGGSSSSNNNGNGGLVHSSPGAAQQQLQLERRRVASLEFAEEDEDDRQVRITVGNPSHSRLRSSGQRHEPPIHTGIASTLPSSSSSSSSSSLAWSLKVDDSGRRTAAQDTFGLHDHPETRGLGSTARQASVNRHQQQQQGSMHSPQGSMSRPQQGSVNRKTTRNGGMGGGGGGPLGSSL